MVFSFGYGLFILAWSFHLGMVFYFGHGLFIWAWSFHLGIVFSFGHGLSWVWCVCSENKKNIFVFFRFCLSLIIIFMSLGPIHFYGRGKNAHEIEVVHAARVLRC